MSVRPVTHELSLLASGVRVVTEAMPAVRSAALGLWIGVGSRDERPEQIGCSHFLEHLLFKGTTRRSARDIAEVLDAVGGELNAFTSKEVTCFYARVLGTDLRLAFDVLADMLVDARNDEQDVESERQVVLSEISIHLDTPDDLVHSDLSELVLRGHPLALETLGSIDSIVAMDRDTIHGYYLDTYRPENITVAAAGDVDHEEIVALADELLGDLGRPGGGGHRLRSAPTAYTRGEVHVRERPTEQAHLVLGGGGLDQHHDDRWALRVLNTLLGGGMSSRLFQELRELRGLCYATYTYTSFYTDGGLFGAYVGTAPGKVDETLQLLRRELDRVAEDVTDDEVERAKGALRGGTVLGLEDTGSRMSRIGKLVATGQEITTIDEVLAQIAAVDVAAVQRVAGEVLSGPHDLAVVGPFSADDTERFATAVG